MTELFVMFLAWLLGTDKRRCDIARSSAVSTTMPGDGVEWPQ